MVSRFRASASTDRTQGKRLVVKARERDAEGGLALPYPAVSWRSFTSRRRWALM